MGEGGRYIGKEREKVGGREGEREGGREGGREEERGIDRRRERPVNLHFTQFMYIHPLNKFYPQPCTLHIIMCAARPEC